MKFDLYEFSARNIMRCVSARGFNHPLTTWSASDWAVAFMGEAGEACNVLKKLNRLRDGVREVKTREELEADFVDELADAFIYLDLLCQATGVDLPNAVISKFERDSAKIGYME
jgi:NTP pyrophosphatase (non-canonical NTP hydrolase)